MSKVTELQDQHEAKLEEFLREARGGGRASDWALVRALIHKAVHLNADAKAGEFCAIATYLAGQTRHAHKLMHGGDRSSPDHGDFLH